VGSRVGPRITAHVLDMRQIAALRQPSPHMLRPFVANIVSEKAGVRPPTQSVTHTDTQTDREKGDAREHTHMGKCVGIEGRPKSDTYIRTVDAHVVGSHRERQTDSTIYLSHTSTYTHTHSALWL
jgi:hypothetical protein